MSLDKKDNQNFEVRFYSGYKGRETPRAVVIGDKEFSIQEILWRRRGRDRQSGRAFETFKCRMEGDIVRITYYESGEWSLSYSEEK